MFSSNNSQVANDAVFVEDVFSNFLYTGNGSTQTITNGIDLSTKGGMTWLKRRDAVGNHVLYDTVRGATKLLSSNNTDAEQTATGGLTAFNTTGFTLGANYPNTNTATFASWTFREQAKFFDVVTFVKDASTNQRISHSLGSVPGCIIVKRITSADDWYVYHRSYTGGSGAIYNFSSLNSTSAVSTGTNPYWGTSAPTSTDFGVSTELLDNTGSPTYVAYVFAHNAGGFGLTGTDNVISCGSFSGAGTTVNLGWEPQWILAKRIDTTGNWYIDDNMRRWLASPSNDNPLLANTSAAEPSGYAGFSNITSTGFTNNYNGDYIYIAIRRGPMKVPTDGTKVFSAVSRAGTGATASITSAGFPPDLVAIKSRNAAYSNAWTDRLRGNGLILFTDSTVADQNYGSASVNLTSNMGVSLSSETLVNQSGTNYINYLFRRAPSFFDEVCWTSDGTYTAQNHNLGVVPELVIQKIRNGADGWYVYTGSQYGFLNTTAAFANFSRTLTSTTFQPITSSSGNTYVQYLFATCTGVSKVGSYTGNGTTQTINCGFTGGARFVLIKRTDSTGDWYVYDTARGMTTLTDPYLLLNSTAAESATLGSVTTVSTGFAVNASILAAINTSGASYIFLAIA